MSELEQLLRNRQASIKVVDLPPVTKCIGIEIKDSITDAEILAVVSALIATRDSAIVKHNSICAQKHVKQDLIFYIDIKVPQAMIEKGLQGLLTNLIPCEFRNDITYDYYSVIDKEEIIRLAKPSGRAFAQAVGILIGAEAPSVFDLTKYTESRGIHKDFDNLVTIVSVDSYSLLHTEIDKFAEYHQFIKEVITHESDRSLFSYNEKLEQVVNSRLVIGPPSFYTYAACCLDVPCVEIFDSQEQLNVFSKWSSHKYAAILRDEAQHFLALRLETAWKHWYGVDVNHQHNILVSSDG